MPARGCPSRPFDPSPAVAQEIRFDLLAEVSVARKRDGSTRGVRSDPILEARMAERSQSYSTLARSIGGVWLARQGERHGFEVLQLDRCEYQTVEFRRQEQSLRVGAVAFNGRLRILDPARFRHAMLTGVGHGKAWGLGLLLCFRSDVSSDRGLQ
jgi:CRISPR system Cascade subunit CasE